MIELLADHSEGLPLQSIADEIGQPKGATHRTLSALAAHGFVGQFADNKRYALTLRLAAIGIKLLEASKLPEVCQPILERLAGVTGELARLAVVENERLIVVAKAQGTRSDLRYDPSNRRDIAVFATAAGLAWLAQLPDTEAVRISLAAGLGRDDLEPPAARTRKQLLQRLNRTRERGYGLQIDEAEAFVSAVALPIFEQSDTQTVVGTISVAGPSWRMPEDRLEAIVPMIREAVAEVSAIWSVRRRTTANNPTVTS